MDFKKKKLFILYISIIIIAIITSLAFKFEYSLTILIFLEIILLTPLLLYFFGIRKNFFEFINISCLYMAFGFGGRYIILKIYPNIDSFVNEQILIQGLVVQVVTMLFFLVSYYLFSKNYDFKCDNNVNITNVTYVIYLIVILSRIYLIYSNKLIVFAFAEQSSGSSILQYAFAFSSLGPTCVGFFMYYYNLNKKNKKRLFFVIVTFVIEVGWALLSGGKTPLLELLIVFFLSKALVNKFKLNFKRTIIAFLLISFVFILNTEIRDSYAQDFGRVQTGLNNQVDVIKGVNLDVTKITTGLTVLLSRNDVLDSVSSIVNLTPNVNPYLYGKQYLYMPLIPIIPRAFWPGKPVYNDGLYNSWLYRGVPQNYYVNYAAGVTGGFYWNFGMIGTIIAMFIYGIIIAILCNWFNRKGIFNEAYFLIYVVIYLKLVTMETTFYTSYVFLFPIILMILIIDFALKIIKKVICQSKR